MDQGDYVALVTAVHGEHLHDIPHDNFGPGDDHVGIVEAGRALGASGLISSMGWVARLIIWCCLEWYEQCSLIIHMQVALIVIKGVV